MENVTRSTLLRKASSLIGPFSKSGGFTARFTGYVRPPVAGNFGWQKTATSVGTDLPACGRHSKVCSTPFGTASLHGVHPVLTGQAA